MEKNTIYVANVVYVDFKDSTLETFVLGCSTDLSIAKAFLMKKFHEMVKMGYTSDKFEFSPWQWEYKHKYGIIKATIDSVQSKVSFSLNIE